MEETDATSLKMWKEKKQDYRPVMKYLQMKIQQSPLPLYYY